MLKLNTAPIALESILDNTITWIYSNNNKPAAALRPPSALGRMIAV